MVHVHGQPVVELAKFVVIVEVLVLRKVGLHALWEVLLYELRDMVAIHAVAITHAEEVKP